MQNHNDSSERIYNCLPSRGVEKDWRFFQAVEGKIKTDARNQSLLLPEQVDLRQDWWKIMDQGKTGSCVGWAVADSVLRYHFAGKKGIPANIRLHKKNNPEHRLSVRFIWMASKETDTYTKRPTTFVEKAGTTLKAALDVLRKYGCPKEMYLPFHPNENSDTHFPASLKYVNEQDFYYAASTHKIRCYHNLMHPQADAKSGVSKFPVKSPIAQSTFFNWKYWLAHRGPVLIRIKVDANFKEKSVNSSKLTAFSEAEHSYHAAAIVGYTKDNEFIIRNSWGTDWKKDGFAFASQKYVHKAITESYGISLQHEPDIDYSMF